MNALLTDLVTAVTQSPKYRHIAPDLIQRIGAEELAKRGSLKEAVKSTKNKLHQVGGAYFEAKVDYEKALAQLENSRAAEAAFRHTCRDLMRLHSSTRERLPILNDFYATILADLPPICRVVDVACGLNPLAIPWMSLAADAEYHAYEIYGDMVEFLQSFFALTRINGEPEAVSGRAHHQDILSHPPTEPADLALILKTLPCLEQVEKGAATRLLDAINARYLLISYPAQSLGGRGKGMVVNYEAQFRELAHGRPWHIIRFEFATELAFLVQTNY